VSTGLVDPQSLPDIVRARCGISRSSQLRAFINAMIDAARLSGRIGMTGESADALAAFRKFNYDSIYMREASRTQAKSVIDLLRALVEHYHSHPQHMAAAFDSGVGPARSDEALLQAVTYVGGMTDRFACRQGIALLGYDPTRLPQGIDV
jgi:dGTPase